ncbi:hypothetical protein HGRIS_013220 [Hohenbuehelia grisea]|uniref:M-phase inducer phosphatase n=1 Tax=Hohenbuehelia grisea TaxID=104357 RepID=A0ABR3IV03_9AGAR
MAFIRRFVDVSHPYKKAKRNPRQEPSSNMSAFMPSKFLNVPQVLSRQSSLRTSKTRDDVDDFLSSDLEISFASTVSLHSPPRDTISLTPQSECVPMDISPAPPPKPVFMAAPITSISSGKPLTRPRAFTSGARLFGRDVSNENIANPGNTPSASKPGSTKASGKRTQRSALPTEWFAPRHEQQVFISSENQSSSPLNVPDSPATDAMDVDIELSAPISYFNAQPHTAAPTCTTFGNIASPALDVVPRTAAPTSTSFGNLFYDTMSPRRSLDSPAQPHPKKRRSVSPEATRRSYEDASSSPAPLSPSVLKLERMASAANLSRLAKPTLEGLGVPSANGLKRPRRPALSAMVRPTEIATIQSAYPVLSSDDSKEEEHAPVALLPPPRRAFSALLPKGFGELSSDEGSFDGPDMSSPAQAYAKRQQMKTIRRCDGTEDFRPLTGATAMSIKDSPSSRFMAPGLPGFGDNEAHGKILPCHRVTDDGLMRISVQTLNALLDGKYNAKIADFHIIDCRFDYEYNGGHIPGAININTALAVEEMLLGLGMPKPKPSVSGDSARKTILVFHCEFSAKRAPTFAKHLRAKDRSMNNHVYPKIHFPEVYILEGGYCQYFKASGVRCQPPAYVTMDDPSHANARREDLDHFRKAKFGRHKSYTYGDGGAKMIVSQPSQPKRNTVPNGANPLFAAANAARTRRGGASGLSTLPEDSNMTSHSDDEDTDIGDSPCPPPTKATAFKPLKRPTRTLVRAETYAPMRASYC